MAKQIPFYGSDIVDKHDQSRLFPLTTCLTKHTGHSSNFRDHLYGKLFKLVFNDIP